MRRRIDVLRKLDARMTARIILLLAEKYKTFEELEAHLKSEVSERELQEINQAALQEGRQPLSFSFKQ